MNETPFPLHPFKLVANFRGPDPAQDQAAAETLYASGSRALKVPLNSPEPLESIEIFPRLLPADAVVGAGTVLTVDQTR